MGCSGFVRLSIHEGQRAADACPRAYPRYTISSKGAGQMVSGILAEVTMIKSTESATAVDSRSPGLCVFCGQIRIGEVYTYHYGAPTKGVNPVTLREHFHPLGQGSEFVCDQCARWSFVRELLHVARIPLAIAALSLISRLYDRLSSGGFSVDPTAALYAFAASAGTAIVMAVLFRMRWNRKFQIESLLFERERNRIARELDPLAAARLRFYDSDFYARNAFQAPPVVMKDSAAPRSDRA